MVRAGLRINSPLCFVSGDFTSPLSLGPGSCARTLGRAVGAQVPGAPLQFEGLSAVLPESSSAGCSSLPSAGVRVYLCINEQNGTGSGVSRN